MYYLVEVNTQKNTTKFDAHLMQWKYLVQQKVQDALPIVKM